jgi:NAD-specific glutamate dehydrogenase
MELKLDKIKGSQQGDELLQQILKDIMAGLRKKMVQPVLEENRKLASDLNQFREEDRAAIRELLQRLEELEDKIQQVPLVILAALRDAINQAGGGSKDAQ